MNEAQELRDLADKIEDEARSRAIWPLVQHVVEALTEYLRAIARLQGELTTHPFVKYDDNGGGK
jgi:hypothetical protein